MTPETRQQIIALVLGLIFIIGFVVLASRIGQFLANRGQTTRVASGQISPTPSPSSNIVKASPTPVHLPQSREPVTMEKRPDSIPNTGIETDLLAALGGLLGAGTFLHRLSRKA
ncbi:LPXTG cell wall anchor domain-containing protein [Candidatus Curtissbacteria bacterium]|nr:LPXTG cell wall anchor domain-containing protein [Candidatus Curtissbacteria bacterium]